jgi:hypothetical protein
MYLENRNMVGVRMWDSEGNTPLRRLRWGRHDNIEKGLKYIDGRAWSGSGQGHVAGCCERGNEL